MNDGQQNELLCDRILCTCIIVYTICILLIQAIPPFILLTKHIHAVAYGKKIKAK